MYALFPLLPEERFAASGAFLHEKAGCGGFEETKGFNHIRHTNIAFWLRSPPWTLLWQAHTRTEKRPKGPFSNGAWSRAAIASMRRQNRGRLPEFCGEG